MTSDRDTTPTSAPDPDNKGASHGTGAGTGTGTGNGNGKRRATTTPTNPYRRAVTRYGAVPVIAGLVALGLLVTGTSATLLTGRPDAGAFAPNGPLLGDGHLFGDDPTNGTRPGDSTKDAGDVTVDLNNDNTPDTRLDANNDGDTDDKNDPTIKQVTDARETITTTVAADAAKTNTTETLLTPPGKDWWTLATSMAPENHLYEQPAPNANWYAVTTSNAVSKYLDKDAAGTYQAVHIGFKTTKDATDYVNNSIKGQDQQWRFPLIRGKVVTFAPSWANPNDEPYPDKVTADLHPRAATWSVSLGKQQAQTVANTAKPQNADALAAFYKALGFTPTTGWNAVATNPNGPWTGKLTDYDAKALDPMTAAEAIGSTVVRECNATKTACNEVDTGLLDLSDVWVFIKNDGSRVGGNDNMLPKNAPKDALLRFGYDQNRVTGLSNGSMSAFTAPVGYLQGWITTDNTMVRYTIPGNTPGITITS